MENLKSQREIKNFCFLIFIFAFWVFWLFNPSKAVIASEFYIESSQNEYRSGDTFIADLKIDNQKECINAIKADIKFSNDLLLALDFTKGDSVLVFWVENPFIDQDKGLISFTGGVPGGYCGGIEGDSGPGNIIGKIILKVKEKNNINSQLSEIKFLDTSEVFLNDGMGTKAKLALRGLTLRIMENAAPAIDEWQKEKSDDDTPPEPFAIEISKDPGIFEGKYFAVFSASDKQTGLDHYEIREGDGQWAQAASPYLLKDQNIKSLIEVKAVDKAGNERMADFNRLRSDDKIKINSVFGLIRVLIILSGILVFWIIIKKIIFHLADKK